MSARVFNPALVSKLRHVRSPSTSDRKGPFTTNCAHLCRNLFGPVDHEEIRRDEERELERLQSIAAQKWEFDFVNEVPLPGSRFIWEATLEKPNMRPLKKDMLESMDDISHLYHVPIEEVSPESELTTPLVQFKKQAKITDYLKVAKNRDAISKLKKASTPSPRARGHIQRTSRRLNI